MKLKDIKRFELRKRIMVLKAEELWDKAVKMWKIKVNYKKRSRWKKFWKSEWSDPNHIVVKDIQMRLLDQEVNEALKTKERKKDGKRKRTKMSK